MVRVKGLEPPRMNRQILSLVRLPISPHARDCVYYYTQTENKMQAFSYILLIFYLIFSIFVLVYTYFIKLYDLLMTFYVLFLIIESIRVFPNKEK